MDISLQQHSSTPLYIQIKLAIREKIIAKELPPLFKLPSERQLAIQLGVHRNTVIKAYKALMDEGLVVSSRQKPCGYFVKQELMPMKEYTGNLFFSATDKHFYYQFLHGQNQFDELYHASYQGDAISFAGVLLHPKAVPLSYLQAMLKDISESNTITPFWFCDAQGTLGLRQQLAAQLFLKNVYVKPKNIQITGETYEAISNIAFMYLHEGDYVLIEEPTCPAIPNIFLHVGAKILTVPVTEDGLRFDVLEHYIKTYHPKLMYVMPDCQNPSTRTMSLACRRQLLQLTQAHHIPILEDCSQYEFWYETHRLPSLYTMDQQESVIYLDSAGLSFYPGARLGYIVAPDSVIKTYRRIVNKDQLFMNSLGQYLWEQFFAKGHYAIHAEFLQHFYQQKRDVLCAALQEIPDITFHVPEGGLVVWVKLPDAVNDEQVSLACEQRGVLVMPGRWFYTEGNRDNGHLRLSFSSLDDDDISKGVDVLRQVLNLVVQ